MKKAILIGGGDFPAVDKEIISQSGKKTPKIVLFPTAGYDSQELIAGLYEKFSPYSTNIEAIPLIEKSISDKEVKEKILSSDIVYISGGCTEILMKEFYIHNIDKYLKEAYEKGVVLSGSSAGAICLSAQGYNDFDSGKYDFINGAGIIPILLGPHYNMETWCDFDISLSHKTSDKHAFALTNGAALICTENGCKAFKALPSDKIYKFSYSKDGWSKKEICDPIFSL